MLLLLGIIILTAILLVIEKSLFRKLMLFLAVLVEVALIFFIHNNVFFFSAQVIIYIGSILTLLVILFLSYKDTFSSKIGNSLAVFSGVLLFITVLLFPVLVKTVGLEADKEFSFFSLREFGGFLVSDYLVFFELVSLLFFMVLIVGVFLLKKYENE